MVTDIDMRGMNGVELATAVRALRPGLPVIYISGHAGTVLDKAPALPGGVFLQKPFELAKMLDLIDTLLSKPDRT